MMAYSPAVNARPPMLIEDFGGDVAAYMDARDQYNDWVGRMEKDRVAGGPAARAAVGTTDPTLDSASAIIRNTLKQYGLDSLGDWALTQLKQGRSTNEVLISLREQDAYKQRFAGMALRKDAGYNSISEADYIAYENQVRDDMRRAGLPDQFLTDGGLMAELIGKNISAAEVNDRLVGAYAQVATAPSEVRNAFGEYFGPQGDGALAAFFLDPMKAQPALEKMVQEAQIAGIGKRVGNINLQQTTAERLAGQGVSLGQAEQGFANVNALRGLTQATAGETGNVSEADLINAQFNLDPNADKVVQARLASRKAGFQGDGGAVVTQQGAIGLGKAK